MTHVTRSDLSLEDNYCLLQEENVRLRRSNQRLEDKLSYYIERSSYLQSEAEYWKETVQEKNNEPSF